MIKVIVKNKGQQIIKETYINPYEVAKMIRISINPMEPNVKKNFIIMKSGEEISCDDKEFSSALREFRRKN